jgi:DNA-directed RNA polymerase III subunit RPC3
LLFRYGRLSHVDLVTCINAVAKPGLIPSALDKTFDVLLSRNCIMAVLPGNDTSSEDLILDKEEVERKNLKTAPSAKEVLTMKAKVKAEIDASHRMLYTQGKRKRTHPTPGFARSTSQSTQPHPTDSLEAPMTYEDANLYWRVNYKRLNAEFRSRYLIEEMERLFGEDGALVMETIIKQTTNQLYDVDDLKPIPQFKPDDVAALIPGSKLRLSNQRHGKNAITDFIQGLCDEEYGYIRMVDHVYMIVDFKVFSQKQQQMCIEEFLADRYGESSLRIWRLLLSRGRLDDRQITRLVLQPVKATREALYLLLRGGFAHIQDVPKTQTDRSAQKTFFLWYVDLTKSREALLDYCYKTIHRMRQRRLVEEQRNPTLRTKLEREDVKANEDELLTEDEKRVLQTMRLSSQRFDTAETALDDMLLRLKEFGFPV